MRTGHRSKGWMFAMGIALMLVGCGQSVQVDDHFDNSLASAAAKGSPVRLADLTDFGWNRLLLFRESWKGSEINAAVGAHVMNDDEYQDEGRALWVFLSDSHVVRAIQTWDRWVLGDPPAPGQDVWLVPAPDDPGWLTFSPNQTGAEAPTIGPSGS